MRAPRIAPMADHVASLGRMGGDGMTEPGDTGLTGDEAVQRMAEAIGIADQPVKVAELRRQLAWVPGNVEDYRRYAASQIDRGAEIERLQRLRQPLRAFLDGIAVDPRAPWDRRALPRHVWRLNWQLVATVRQQDIHALINDNRDGAALRARIRAVQELCRAAELAIANLRRDSRPGRGGPRHKHDVVRNAAAAWLITVYERVTGRQAATSTDVDGQPGGPLVRFLRAGMPYLGFTVGGSAAAYLIRRHRQSGGAFPSPD